MRGEKPARRSAIAHTSRNVAWLCTSWPLRSSTSGSARVVSTYRSMRSGVRRSTSHG
jgi:hypothetical protein